MRVALLGLGVVGSGVYELLYKHKSKLVLETGLTIEIVYGLVKEITPEIVKKYSNIKVVDNVDLILNDEQIDCIIEVMGGVDFPYLVISKALSSGINVVSANKDLISEKGVELLSLAKLNNCDFYYEASVCGGIPLLRTISKGLIADNINSIVGILNGTSNYILTKMSRDNVGYKDALLQAQKLGFAESDPTSDVEGYDTARKIAILARLAFHVDIVFSDVSVKGITNITESDINIARNLGYVFKLIGHIDKLEDGLYINVEPTLISEKQMLSNVDYEMNAVIINSSALKDTMYYGAGAGSHATATAVLSDVMNIAQNIEYNCLSKDIVLPTIEKKISKSMCNTKFLIIEDGNYKVENMSDECIKEIKNTATIYPIMD